PIPIRGGSGRVVQPSRPLVPAPAQKGNLCPQSRAQHSVDSFGCQARENDLKSLISHKYLMPMTPATTSHRRARVKGASDRHLLLAHLHGAGEVDRDELADAALVHRDAE